MNRRFRSVNVWLAIAAVLVAGVVTAKAEEEETGWRDTAELSLVVTGGNSEASTFGFSNVLLREWDRSLLTIKAGGIRVQTTTTTRTPVAPDPLIPLVFNVVESSTDTTTAENYYLSGRYDRKITDRFFWYAGTGWDRNRFAGIQNRYLAEGGVGNIWIDEDDVKFSTGYGLTFTDQEDVNAVPGSSDTFLGARASWDYMNKFGANTVYNNVLIIDENLDETSDYRANMINSLAVSMSEKMALKLGLQLLYDNEPSFDLLEVVDSAGNILGPIVPVPFDDLDTIFTASLVINFK